MGLFYNLRTLWKLLLGFGVVCGIMTFVGWLGVAKTAQINGLLNSMYEKELLGVSESKEANINLIYISRAARNALLESDPQIIQQVKLQVTGYFEQFEQRIRATAETIYSEDGRQLLSRIQASIPEYQAEIGRSLELCSAGDIATGGSGGFHCPLGCQDTR